MDNYSKILLALHVINYSSAAINGVMLECATMADAGIQERNQEKARFLEATATKLSMIAEEVADFCNACDMVTEEDAEVLGPVSHYLFVKPHS